MWDLLFWSKPNVLVSQDLITSSHEQKLLRYMKITNLFLGLNLWKLASPSPPPFSMLETNKHPQSVLQHCLGGRGWPQMKKMFSFQCKIVLLNCLNTFIHDCLYFISALKLALGHEEDVSSFLTEFYIINVQAHQFNKKDKQMLHFIVHANVPWHQRLFSR